MVGPLISTRVCLSTLHTSAQRISLPASLGLLAALPPPPTAVWVSGWLCAEGRGSALPPPPRPHLSDDPGRAAAAAELRPGSRAAAEEDPRG